MSLLLLTLITSPSERSNDDSTLALQQRNSLRGIRIRRVRHHAAQRTSRDGSLRPLLLRHVRGRSDRGRLGHVADPKVVSSRQSPVFSHSELWIDKNS